MEEQFRKVMLADIESSDRKEFLQKICNEYFQYYFSQSMNLQAKLSALVKKYNSKTILSFLGPNSYPHDYTHMSLGHSIGEKNLIPMLDNGGGIYSADEEIGQICVDPDLWGDNESDEENELRWKYHGIIFYCWLAINWIEMEGYKAGIVVKTTENNSVLSFFLNDFQFDEYSKFENVENWKGAVEKYNRATISLGELLYNVKRNFRD